MKADLDIFGAGRWRRLPGGVTTGAGSWGGPLWLHLGDPPQLFLKPGFILITPEFAGGFDEALRLLLITVFARFREGLNKGLVQ
jgi:hypothetical protein